MSRGSYAICWAVAILTAVAPLPFGSVDPLPSAVLQLCLLSVALAWVTLRAASGLSPLPWRDPLLAGGAALLAYGLLQMTPLPPALLAAISPAAAAIRSTYSPEPSAWAPLSIYPYATWRSCVNVACLTLVASMVRHCAVDLKGRLVVTGGLVVGGLFQAGYGLFEFISGRQHIFGYQKKYFTDVATGTFISRNNYAGYLEMAIPMGLALAMLALGRTSSTAGGARSPLKRRLASATGQESFHSLVLLMGVFLMAMALLMSRSRMGIIASVVSLVVGGLAIGLKGRSRRFALASVAVALVAGVFATQIDIMPVVNRFEALRLEVGAGFGRYRAWRDAVPMMAAHPIFGTGLGTWEMAFSPYRTDTTQARIDFAHNDYLEFASESGAIGLVILAAAAAAVLRRRAREFAEQGRPVGHDEIALGAGAGLIALALHSLTDFHMSIPADALAAAVLAGLFLRQNGPAPLARREATLGIRARPHLAWSVCLLALVSLLVSVASPAVAEIRAEPPPSAEDDAKSADGTTASSVTAHSPDDDLCPECRLEPFNALRCIDGAARARERLLKDVEVLVRSWAAGELGDPATRIYMARRIDTALALARRGLGMAPASGRGHLEAGLLEFGRFALIGLPPEASEDFERALVEFNAAMALQPWRAATHRRVARLLAPLWEECDAEQRSFIEKATRRALVIDPWAADIKQAAARMGI